jgi:hypothetical protein
VLRIGGNWATCETREFVKCFTRYSENGALWMKLLISICFFQKQPISGAVLVQTDCSTTLPLEYQQSFLENHPINKAVLEAAKEHGLN